MKISEPKTPYVHYHMETDQILSATGETGSGCVSWCIDLWSDYVMVDFVPPMDLNAALQQYKEEDFQTPAYDNANSYVIVTWYL